MSFQYLIEITLILLRQKNLKNLQSSSTEIYTVRFNPGAVRTKKKRTPKKKKNTPSLVIYRRNLYKINKGISYTIHLILFWTPFPSKTTRTDELCRRRRPPLNRTLLLRMQLLQQQLPQLQLLLEHVIGECHP